MKWFRKSKVSRTSQIHDLETVWNLLHDVAKLSMFYNIPSALDKILDASTDVRKYIDALKKEYK